MVQAILFDADGVLADPGEMHYQAFNRALACHGWCITRHEHRTIYNGLPTRAKLAKLTAEKDLPEELHLPILLAKERFTRQTIIEYLEPDVTKTELLRRLKADGFALGVAGNMLQGALTLMMSRLKLLPYLDVCVGNDLQRPPKPAPNLYRTAAALIGQDIRTCAIVVDSPVARDAAAAANPYDIIEVTGPDDVTPALLPRLTRSWLERAA